MLVTVSARQTLSGARPNREEGLVEAGELPVPFDLRVGR